jgi:hypothetical protein
MRPDRRRYRRRVLTVALLGDELAALFGDLQTALADM